MESHLQALVAYFSAHTYIALAAVFAAALLEAVALIGSVIPGSSIVFVGGVLVGLQALNPWWTAAAAIAGAIVGDGASYWLGHRYHDRIRALRPMRRYCGLLDRGQAYFASNGGKSVFVARFLGPLRAIVPVVAGMSNMPAAQFYAMNALSALAWAAAHLLPGVLFGASLQLAGAVSSRLAVMLVAVVAASWLIAKLVRLAIAYGWPRLKFLRDRAVGWARGRSSGPLARIVLSLLDPERPESRALLIGATVLIGSAWLFLGVLQDVIANDPLVQFDQTVYRVLQQIRTTWADNAMVAVTEMGGGVANVPVIVAVSLLFAFRRKWRTLAYWLAALGFAELLVWTLKLTLGRARPHNFYSGLEQFAFPSGHATMAIVMYGFAAFLLAHRRSARARIGVALLAAAVISVIAFSRLYLGVHWFSDIVASLSLGLAWLALVATAYVHHVRDERIPAMQLAVTIVATLALVAGTYMRNHHAANVSLYQFHPHVETIALTDWTATAWSRLPEARSELGGEMEEPFTVQWAGSARDITAALSVAGWRVPVPWTIRSSLLWVLPANEIGQLPVVPKFDHGAPPEMTFVQVTAVEERMVLRLWRSNMTVQEGAKAPARPLWIGTATVERLRHPGGVMTLARTKEEFSAPTRILHRGLQEHGESTALRDTPRGAIVLVW